MLSPQNLKLQIVDLLREELRGLWDQEDPEFLATLVEDIAREKVLATTSNEPGVHEQNLRHLAATIQGEVVRKEIRLTAAGRQFFVQALTLVIRTIALPALKAWIG
jgi:hypothetical protein